MHMYVYMYMYICFENGINSVYFINLVAFVVIVEYVNTSSNFTMGVMINLGYNTNQIYK